MKKHNIQVRGKRALAFLPFYLLTFLLFSACAHEEDDLFPESAAQRINHSVAEWKQVLADDPNGWVMEYLPADGSYGGYLFTVKLNGTEAVIGTVDVTFKSNDGSYPPGTEETSKYSVKAEQGVILSFDTYSQFFHFFSEPRGSSAPDGYQGDYEFVLNTTSADGDTVYMKGKKYGNDIRMYKLKGMSTEDFVDRIVSVRNGLFATSFSGLQAGDSTYQVTIGRNMVVTDSVTSAITSVPVFFTTTGFHMYSPLTLNGKSFQDFHGDNSRESLVAEDNDVYMKVGKSVKEQIEKPKGYGEYGVTHYGWYFDVSQMDAESKEMYEYILNHVGNAAVQAFLTWQGLLLGPCTDYDLFFNKKNVKQTLSCQWDAVLGYISFIDGVTYTYNPDNETLSIEYVGENDINSSYTVFYSRSIEPLFNRIVNNSPYKVSLNDFFIKTHMKLESINNPNVYFGLDLASAFDNLW